MEQCINSTFLFYSILWIKYKVKYVDINGKISGIVLWHLDLQISLAHISLDQQLGECGHIVWEYLLSPFYLLHQHLKNQSYCHYMTNNHHINNIYLLFTLTFLIVSNKCFGNGLTNGIDLCHMSTTIYSHSDINSRELFLEHKIDECYYCCREHFCVRTTHYLHS